LTVPDSHTIVQNLAVPMINPLKPEMEYDASALTAV
jgi:hypothetical protein